MNSLLKLKHWQLFAISWGPGLLLNFFAVSDPVLIMKLFPVVMLFFTVSTFGWIWAIATALHQQLPPRVHLPIGRFKILFAIPVVYNLSILIGASFLLYGGSIESLSGLGGQTGVFIFLHLFSMFCIFYGIRFAAKTIKSIELGRPVSFDDYAGEFFLIWFSIIGHRIVQPRLNNPVGNNTSQPSLL